MRKRLEKLEESQSEQDSRRILASEFDTVDDILVFCYTKLVERSGIVYGWGSNWQGEITDQPQCSMCGSNVVHRCTQSQPRFFTFELKKLGTVTNIHAGYHTSFVVKDAKLFAVGYNEFSQLGLGAGQPDEVLSPAKVELPPIRSAVNFGFSSFAIDTSGRLLSWGDNRFGQLGRKTQGSEDATPQRIDSLKKYKIKQVAGGHCHVCCLTTDGEVFIWGIKDSVGRLGSDIKIPSKLNVGKMSQIACGDGHTLLLSEDKKTIWAFGHNYSGQLGHDPELKFAETPVKVPFSGDKVIVKLQCIVDNSATLSEDGEIRIWGRAWNDRNPNSMRRFRINQAVDIAIGGCFMLVLTAENQLYAFGKNDCGQCGNESTREFIERPVQVRNLDNLRIKQISAGYDHCLIKCVKI